jgi:hypothetical protein
MHPIPKFIALHYQRETLSYANALSNCMLMTIGRCMVEHARISTIATIVGEVNCVASKWCENVVDCVPAHLPSYQALSL